MKHKPYPKYKPSGIDWIEDIPEGWGIRRLKFFSKIISKGTTPSTIGREILSDGNIRFLKAENIQEGEIQKYPEFFIDEETNKLLKRSELKEEDILFVIAGATIGKAGLLKKEFLPANTNQAVSFVRLVKGVNKKFILYWLQSVYIKRLTWLNAVQSAQPNLSMESLGDFAIPYPDTEGEQQQIANYLDQKTVQIDDLIQKKEEMIKLLKEKRAAIINQAITKGLDPNAKMKPSGIDWIGDIPEGWKIERLKNWVDLINESEESEDEKFLVDLDNIESFTGKLLNETEGSGKGMKMFATGDVLLNKLRPYLAKVFYGEKYGCCGGELLVLRPKDKIVPKFLFYRVLSIGFINLINNSSYGVKMPRANWDYIGSVFLPYSNKQEQQAIVCYLDSKTEEIDSLIKKIEDAIAKLREYRSSLITAAVTGKIDVRGK